MLEVRRAAYRVGWIDARIETLKDRADRSLSEVDEHEREVAIMEQTAARVALLDWIKESRAERQHLAAVCQKAISAGLNQRILSQIQLERDTLTRVITAAIIQAELEPDDQDRFIQALRLQIDGVATERRGIDGELDTGPVGVRVDWSPYGPERRAHPVEGTNPATRFEDE